MQLYSNNLKSHPSHIYKKKKKGKRTLKELEGINFSEQQIQRNRGIAENLIGLNENYCDFPVFLRMSSMRRKFDTAVSVSLLRDDYLGFRETRNAIALIVCSLYDSGPGIECRLVRRNMIPQTFLAYIATHYMIESKRTTGPGSRQNDRKQWVTLRDAVTETTVSSGVSCILPCSPLCRPDVSEGSGSGSRRQDGIIQGHFGFQVGGKTERGSETLLPCVKL